MAAPAGPCRAPHRDASHRSHADQRPHDLPPSGLDAHPKEDLRYDRHGDTVACVKNRIGYARRQLARQLAPGSALSAIRTTRKRRSTNDPSIPCAMTSAIAVAIQPSVNDQDRMAMVRPAAMRRGPPIRTSLVPSSLPDTRAASSRVVSERRSRWTLAACAPKPARRRPTPSKCAYNSQAGGRVVKFLGDGAMLHYRDAVGAVRDRSS
jgi:hypothetical protein